ncbi:hypothetical protein Pelo_3600 [Pelomyxa schiedti]|nr:hypothetical protein Pelo_3600 [Pelomyxa schiedti]
MTPNLEQNIRVLNYFLLFIQCPSSPIVQLSGAEQPSHTPKTRVDFRVCALFYSTTVGHLPVPKYGQVLPIIYYLVAIHTSLDRSHCGHRSCAAWAFSRRKRGRYWSHSFFSLKDPLEKEEKVRFYNHVLPCHPHILALTVLWY